MAEQQKKCGCGCGLAVRRKPGDTEPAKGKQEAQDPKAAK